ncbi:Vacuolar protein sorting-associated protein 11, partial [Spiromyces aspiralis]
DTGLIFVADLDTGYMHIVDEELSVRSFLVVDEPEKWEVTRIVHLPDIQALIVAKASKASNVLPIIELWHLERIISAAVTSDETGDGAGHPPVAVAIQSISIPYQLTKNKMRQDSQGTVRVTAMDALPRATQVALGFNTGQVVLVRGNIAKRRATKHKIIYQHSGPITNLHFTHGPDDQAVLFVITPESTVVCNTARQSGSSSDATPVLLDYNGCDFGCSFITKDGKLAIACDSAIYFFSSEGRQGCFAFNGSKSMTKGFRRYILLATSEPSPMAPVASGGSGDGNDMAAAAAAMFASETTTGFGEADTRPYYLAPASPHVFTILDNDNRFVAYTGLVEGGIRAIITEWGTIFVLNNEGQLLHFEDKDLSGKLEILYRQNLYPTAIKVAKNENYDKESLAGIYKRYGDYLYNKGELDAAMNQYITTVGYVEPSYVIRKFLDIRGLDKLTRYVHELHVQGIATADHTTLLVNCYTKLKDEGKLDEFLQREQVYQFDVTAAISVCRQAGYTTQALLLAEKCEQRDMYFEILIYDKKDYGRALEYLGGLSLPDRARLANELGGRLLKELPRATTELLIGICRELSLTAANDDDGDTAGSRVPAQRFFHLFANHPAWLVYFIEQVGPEQAGSGNGVLEEREDADEEVKLVWNTLLELYLTGVDVPAEISHSEPTREGARAKALRLLRTPGARFDWDQAYLLCALDGFEDGMALLCEQKGDPEALLRLAIDSDDVPRIMRILEDYGSQHPRLYSLALQYFVQNPMVLAQNETESPLSRCLDAISKGRLIHPLEVLQILTQSSGAALASLTQGESGEDGYVSVANQAPATSAITIGMVRDYLLEQVESTQSRIDHNQRVIDSYVAQNAALKDQMSGLQNQPVIFQGMRCSHCRAPLDLPSAHFLCRHSYHQRCLGESTSCPLCLAETQTLEHQRRQQEIMARQHDAFFNELKNREDGFEFIAECFSRNPFTFTKLAS